MTTKQAFDEIKRRFPNSDISVHDAVTSVFHAGYLSCNVDGQFFIVDRPSTFEGLLAQLPSEESIAQKQAAAKAAAIEELKAKLRELENN